MVSDDELQSQQMDAARAEIRRIAIDRKPPTGTPLEAFGPWAEYVGPLRQMVAERGVTAAQELGLALVRSHPNLAVLLATDPKRRKAGWTMAELMAASFPRAGWIVPGLLPTGLSTLAGRPKMGKSWLALQIACAVGAGGRVLDRAVEQGPVLYIALEDSPRRLQERLRKQGSPQADLTFALEWQSLAAGGLGALRTAIEEREYKLVIVDTLNRALGRAEQLDLAAMTLLIGSLQNVTKVTGAAILTVDHHKKPIGNTANPIDDILGSTGKAALVDAALGLYRERGRHDATLRAVGRDMEAVELYIRWDGERCCWQAVGEAGEVRKESLQSAILDAIRELSELGEITSTTNIARHLNRQKPNVSHELADLLQDGKIVKGPKVGCVVPYFLVRTDPPPHRRVNNTIP